VENEELDLGVASVRAESFGEPGQRTFRLLIENPSGKVSLWLEKEQLVVLGSALEELLQRIPPPHGTSPRGTPAASFIGELEVRAGALAIGYDGEVAGFTIEASQFDSPFGLKSIKLVASRDDFSALAQQITGIAAAGRPRCPLCGTPISASAHFCPPSNGHTRLTRSE
jgi:uncharacterized repeat protein (TIGR03847 family)